MKAAIVGSLYRTTVHDVLLNARSGVRHARQLTATPGGAGGDSKPELCHGPRRNGNSFVVPAALGLVRFPEG